MLPKVCLKCVLALACLVATLAQSPYAPSAAIAGWTAGQASEFGGPQEGWDIVYNATVRSGSCGYGTQDVRLWPFVGMAGVSRISPVSARPMGGCGTCLEVQCTDTRFNACTGAGPITVTVLDTCASCNATRINLFALAFQEIGRIKFGTIAVEYRQVACKPPDNIEVRVDARRPIDGGYLRLTLRNVAGDGGLTAVDIRGSANASAAGVDGVANAWQPMVNGYGAAWEASRLQPDPAGGFDLRATNAVGETIIISNAIPAYTTPRAALGSFFTSAQFTGTSLLSQRLAASGKRSLHQARAIKAVTAASAQHSARSRASPLEA
ncbi:hypothetical protein V8C86DRAFT_3134537 [Haematococcus lacustris]